MAMNAMIDTAYQRKIFVNDDDYNKNNKYKTAGKEIEDILTEYIEVLETLSSSSSGKLADNLNKLKELTNIRLHGIIEENYTRFAKYMKEYKFAIDKADSDLYR